MAVEKLGMGAYRQQGMREQEVLEISPETAAVGREALPNLPHQESLLATSQLSTLRRNTNLIGQIPERRLGQVYLYGGSVSIKKKGHAKM